MSHRCVSGLLWAQARERGPWGPGRARGAKAHGLRYERALAKALPGALHGQWFEFADRNGRGWCQPDLIRNLGDALLVLEAKFTWVPDGQRQIDQLYRPVVERAWGLPVLGVVVCKVLAPGATDVAVTGDLAVATALARQHRPVVLHWLGSGPLTGMGTTCPSAPALPTGPRPATISRTLEELGL